VLFRFLAVFKISFINGIGVSGVPAVSEPSKRIRLFVRVFVSVVWSHFSSRFAMRFGICVRFSGYAWTVSFVLR